jgi:exodeoxyribonuclease V gamma subunit
MVVSHPLHPFSRKYFAGGGSEKLFSYNDYYCRTAAALQEGMQPKEGWWQGRIEGEVTTVNLANLLRFAASPQKFFVSDILGIRLDLGVELPEERELFHLTGLDRYLVDQDLLQLGIDGRLSDGFTTVVAEGRWPLGTPGTLAFREKSRAIESFLHRVDAQQMGQKQTGLSVDLTLDGYQLVGTLNNIHENGIFLLRFGKLRGRDLLTGWIHHLLAQRFRPGAVTRIVALDTTIGFDGQSEGPDLLRLLTLFAEACRRPLPLFLEPGLVYARQAVNPKSRTAPIDKARAAYRASMDKGYEPEWALLYGSRSAEEVLDAEFEELCLEILCPQWRSADAN